MGKRNGKIRIGGIDQDYMSGSASVLDKLQDAIQIHDFDVNLVLKPVGSFLTDRASILSLQMQVIDNALLEFEIHYKYSLDGEYIQRASAALDFTTPNSPILDASGSFLTAIVSNNHWLKLDVSGIYAVQLWAASGNAAGSEIILNAGTE